MTPVQIMLLDILTDKLITIGTTIRQIQDMTDDQITAEINKWDARRAAAMDELNKH